MTKCHVRATYNEVYRTNGARFVFSIKTMKIGHCLLLDSTNEILQFLNNVTHFAVPYVSVQINSSDYHNILYHATTGEV